jgi:hypothetical protein
MEEHDEDGLFSLSSIALMESPVMRAKQMLAKTLRDPAKAEERRHYLEEHPEARITVDVPRLKEIVPYVEFKCNPDSSASKSRNAAVKNSDIDGGLVVLNEAVGTKKQEQFVAALRDMGYDVCHSSELSRARREYDRAESDEQKRIALEKIKNMTFNVIEFKTKEELERQKAKRVHDSVLNVYLAGEEVA